MVVIVSCHHGSSVAEATAAALGLRHHNVPDVGSHGGSSAAATAAQRITIKANMPPPYLMKCAHV